MAMTMTMTMAMTMFVAPTLANMMKSLKRAKMARSSPRLRKTTSDKKERLTHERLTKAAAKLAARDRSTAAAKLAARDSSIVPIHE